jgi:hypothetical protein
VELFARSRVETNPETIEFVCLDNSEKNILRLILFVLIICTITFYNTAVSE